MMKTFKKAIAIAMTLVFILSLVPFSVMAEESDFKTVQFKFIKGQTTPINFGNTRNDEDYMSVWYPHGYTAGEYGIYLGSGYPAYVHIDFSGYEEILRNTETTISMTMRNRGTDNVYKINDFKIYLAPDSCDSIIFSDGTTFNQAIAVATGFYDKTRPIFFSRSDATAVASYSSGELDPSNVLNVMDENTENSILSLYMQGGGSATRLTNTGSTYISIRYNEKEIDNQDYVDVLAEELSWEKFSADSAGSVTEYPDLPLKYKGANITWTSSNPEIFNTETGLITRLRGEDVPVKLTANLSYTDFAGNSVTAEKEINITVAGIKPTVKKVSALYTRQTNVKYPDTAYKTSYDSFFASNNVLNKVPNDSSKGDSQIFTKFDLSDSLKELEIATDVAFVLINRNDSETSNAMVTVLSDRYDEWPKDITYNSAADWGMYTDPGYGTAYGVTIKKSPGKNPTTSNPYSSYTPIEDAAFSKAIKDAVAANPDEGLVTFRINSRDWNQIAMQGNPRIEITYYEEDLMTDTELQTAKKDKVQWSALTTQDIDNVVADLDLPATWYGAPVTWASSDESVISSSGEVTIGDVAKEVTLTATVDDVVNTFVVTVPANKIALKSERSHRLPTYSNGGSNLNYSAANIYANEDIEGTPDVIIATYSADGETLLDVTVKEDVTIKKGYTCVPSGYHYQFGDKVTKAIVVDDITTLNPLGIAR